MLRRLRAWKTRRQVSKRGQLALKIGILERDVREAQKKLIPSIKMISKRTDVSRIEDNLMLTENDLRRLKNQLAAIDKKLKI